MARDSAIGDWRLRLRPVAPREAHSLFEEKRGQKTRVQDGAVLRKPTIRVCVLAFDKHTRRFFFLLDWHECFLTAYRQSNLIHTPKPPLITKGLLFRAFNQSGLSILPPLHTAFDASIGHDSAPLSSRLLRILPSSSFPLFSFFFWVVAVAVPAAISGLFASRHGHLPAKGVCGTLSWASNFRRETTEKQGPGIKIGVFPEAAAAARQLGGFDPAGRGARIPGAGGCAHPGAVRQASQLPRQDIDARWLAAGYSQN